MAVTFTTAAQRTRSFRRNEASRFGRADLLIVATSGVIAIAIVLTCVGRLAVARRAEPAAGVVPIDLNAVDRAELLEPALAVIAATPDDRRTLASDWFAFLSAQRRIDGPFPNVATAVRGLPRIAAHLAALKPSFVVRSPDQFRRDVIVWGLVYLIAFQLAAWLWRLHGRDGDRALLAAAHLITGLGFLALLSRPDPLRDVPLFVRYTEGIVAGLLLMSACSFVDFGKAAFLELSYVPLLGAIALCALLIVFGNGPGHSGAKVNLGPVQPIEAIRLLLALFLAGYFARRWELLRGVRARAIRGVEVPRWIDIPHGAYLLPVVAGVVIALALFAIQKDLGPALLLCCVFLTTYAIARGGFRMAIAGLALLVGGFYAGHILHVSRTLSERVLMWRSPWDNAVAGGDQVAQALWAMAAGGPLGTGLGLGDTRYISAGHTDLMIAAVGEELGIVGLIVLVVAYGVMAWRGFRIAQSASSDYGFFLATTLTLFLIVPVLVMAAGIVGVIPLTGIVTPFLSYGGSAMTVNLTILGVLSSIRAAGTPAPELAPFSAPLRRVGAVIAVAVVAIAVMIANVQVVRADEYLVRPHLGIQADGGRRFVYNPRLQELVRRIQRGTIFDRRGLPIATDDPQIIARARAPYQKLGIALDDVCASPSARCYPLGGRAFHLLGDARTRMNWSAPNTSYIERDAETALRGFDDRAVVVSTTDASGRAMTTVRRDYRDLVPLLRHRYQPDHPAVVAFRARSSDLKTTIDAALQIRVAAIVEEHAKRTSGRAAAIVLDPDTGGVLASASYPWPSADGEGDGTEEGTDALLDRARYGLYPPGSTFKLVTAAAALNHDVNSARTEFACTRLPDGRIGTVLRGWSRPVRDDVLDAHPHGTIDMRAGIVHSCNAYFAQLALQLGPQPLIDCATRLGIALTPSSTPAARVRDTLPQVGYGQADVLASPLRMARLAAAVAASGTLRDAHWDQSSSKATPWLAPGAARLLGSYMREVVVSGTGASLRNQTWPIAGKTGTAEVAGAPSHGWFVGYAPYGAAKKRIAFAVVIENAGYGGRTAAPVAGEIVTAAGLSGLLQ